MSEHVLTETFAKIAYIRILKRILRTLKSGLTKFSALNT